MNIIGFFNNKGGVGKTSLVYHLAHTFADMGKTVVAADLDSQANLTAMFLSDEEIERYWGLDSTDTRPNTIFRAIKPLMDVGDVLRPECIQSRENLFLVAGDMNLSTFEDELSENWGKCLEGAIRPFRIISAFYRALRLAADAVHADVVLVDVGPNMGAVNRAALIAVDFVLIPVGADLFAIQGLMNLGPQLRKWREGWEERLRKFGQENPSSELQVPPGSMMPIGYVAMQHAIRSRRPTQAYEKWLARVPTIYRRKVLNEAFDSKVLPAEDPHRLATIKHYRSLMPMAQTARKPIFHLESADGAIGAHYYAVKECQKDFQELARCILGKMTAVEQSHEAQE